MGSGKNLLARIGGYRIEVDELSFQLLQRIWETGGSLQKDIEEFLKTFNLSHGRFSILLNLYEHQGEGVYPSEIARALKKTRPTISGMVRKLVEGGLVSESGDGMDERKKKVRLERKGFKILEKIIPLYDRRISSFTERLTVEEKKMLLSLVEKINSAIL